MYVVCLKFQHLVTKSTADQLVFMHVTTKVIVFVACHLIRGVARYEQRRMYINKRYRACKQLNRFTQYSYRWMTYVYILYIVSFLGQCVIIPIFNTAIMMLNYHCINLLNKFAISIFTLIFKSFLFLNFLTFCRSVLDVQNKLYY